MSRYIGNYLRVPSSEPQQASAPGIWSLSEQLNYQRANLWPPARDPYYNQTVLHLSGDVAGTRETNPVTQPRTFLSDASTNNFLLTPNGDVSARPFSPYLENYSGYAPGNCYLDIASNSGFNLSDNANFTIEFWINCPATSGALWIASGWQNTSNLSWSLSWRSNNAIEFYGRQSSGGAGTIYYVNNSGDNTVLPNTWTHYAVVRNSSTISVYVNGNLINTGTINGTPAPSTNCRFFGDSLNGSQLTGYISNFRFSRSAVYTQPFTPATQPLTTTSQGASNVVFLGFNKNRFVDVANNLAFTFTSGNPAISANSPFVSLDTTSGSGYFDGSGDYLSTSNSAFAVGTGAFTIEAWVYPFTVSGKVLGGSLASSVDPAGDRGIGFYLDGARIGRSVTAQLDDISTSILPIAYQWNHIALVRENTSTNGVKFYVNGLLGGQGTSAISVNKQQVVVGRQYPSEDINYFSGYISSVRWTNAAVYSGTSTTTANFTLPTSSLQAVANTQLLTLQTRAPANNQGILDTSPNSLVVTRNGNVAQGSFSPFSASGYSVSTTATNTLDLPGSVLAFGSSSFTVEAWVYATHTSGAPIVYPYNSGNAVTSGGFSVSFGTGGVGYYAVNGATPINYSATIPLNTWYHLALVKDGSAARLYLNGQLVATGTDSTTYTTPTGGARVGGIYNLTQTYGLVVNNLRIVTGQALYNANFTPATTNLTASVIGHQGLENTAITGTVRILTARDPYRIDRSSNNHTIGSSGSPQFLPISPFAPTQAYVASQLGGSAYFDSSGDSLTIPSAPALNMTGDFCMEAWAYPSAANITFAWKYVGGNVGSSEYWWTIDGTNQLSIALDGGGGEDYFRTAANTITLNAWNHCVVTRVGTAVRQFINGVLQSYNTTSRTLNITSTNFLTSAASGYISGLRIMRGSIPDIYQTTATTTGTAVFIPPTTPVISVPGTSLLLNFTGAGIVDSTGRNNLETMGNSSVQTKVLKYGNVATYIPNTASTGSNKLVAPNFGGNFSFGTGDLTIEAWFYLITLPSGLTTPNNEAIFSCGSNGPILAISGNAPNTNKIVFANYGGTLTIYSTNTVSAGVWYHVAVSRASGNTRLYINGALEGSSTTVEAMNASNTITIGQDPVGNNQAFNGYIDSLRITKGYARYVNGTASNASQMVFNGTNILAIPTLTFPLA